MRSWKTRCALTAIALSVSACTEDRDDDPFAGASSAGISAGTDGAGPGGSASSGATDSAGGGDTGPAGDDTPVLDVGFVGDVSGNCAGDSDCSGCTAVDLLFVIDNSVSMGDYQNALGLAFPRFAQTLVDTLPAGTNVHVGVTSTEMGYSSSGNTSITNGVCSFIGDGQQTNDMFYVTPDQNDTGRNGAQGRLYDPGGGQPYFAFDTSAPDLPALETWFSAAANIGEGGSNIEMSAAPVGWFADPANAATNSGFLRDAGAVLVVFFMQDEPDQTPRTVEGQPAGPFVLDRLAEAKAECGGLECVVAGGFLNANACSAEGNLPLDDLLAGVGATVVDTLPAENLAENDPDAAATQMNELLSETLADIIVSTCDAIPPVG